MHVPAATPRADATRSFGCIIPCSDEARNLPGLLTALRPALQARSPHREVLLVDDGNRDETAAVGQPFVADGGVRYRALSRNFGKEAALSAGLDHARGDLVLMLDADGQHPLQMLQRMLEGWREGADTVCAVRETRADESLAKRQGTALLHGIVNAVSPLPIPRDAGDFRLMDRRVVNALLTLPDRNRFLKGLNAWGPAQQKSNAAPDFCRAGC